METLGMNVIKALFSSYHIKEIETCDPIELDDNDLNHKKNKNYHATKFGHIWI